MRLLRFVCRVVAGSALVMAVVTSTAPADDVQLFVATPLPKAAQSALAEFQQALVQHDVGVQNVAAAPKTDVPAIIVGVAGESPTFDQFLEDAKVEIGAAAESSTAAWITDRKQTLVLAGRDERGLTYALRDAARGLAVAARPSDWTKAITPAVESPFLRVRNVSLHLFNADCEREWFFSEDFGDSTSRGSRSTGSIAAR